MPFHDIIHLCRAVSDLIKEQTKLREEEDQKEENEVKTYLLITEVSFKLLHHTKIMKSSEKFHFVGLIFDGGFAS